MLHFSLSILLAAPLLQAAPQSLIAPPQADRQAILAMVGDFDVQFRFEETVACVDAYSLKPVYTADATESVRVIEDSGDVISLQHILVLDGGFDRPPKIVKHWRQTWTWQDDEIVEYRGHETFERRALAPAESTGTWSQAVFQTNDQPRYEGFGRWTHVGTTSTWVSNESWRPLPRREATKRSDYHVVQCRNVHTVTERGWVHEQENRKLVLDEQGAPVRILALEHGLNTYMPTTSEDALVDFGEADRYWAATSDFWASVRSAWAEQTQQLSRFHIAREVDGEWIARSILVFADQVYRPEGRDSDGTAAEASAIERKSPLDAARETIRRAVTAG